MKRLYDELIKKHLEDDRLMLFLTGPRQVGKTTSTKQTAKKLTEELAYFNWDDPNHRDLILQGPAAIMQQGRLEYISKKKPLVIFDEIHKYPDWKNLLKGMYDSYSDDIGIIVTGSARLDIYKKGGDSLMGRYFPYRMHPLSVGECLHPNLRKSELLPPKQPSKSMFKALLQFGGFPMPFIKKNTRFSNRWQRLRREQLFREEIRDISNIQDIDRLEVLASIISHEASQPMTYSNLAKKIRVSVDTIRRWIVLLESFYYCFLIRPWSRNITRSLIKEPKIFLWDWSNIRDPGRKTENFIASHLLKSIHFWNDMGFGEYGLYYLRDLDKHEVDFIITKNDQPWFIVEVKKSNNTGISKNLYLFQEQTQAKHAFQVVLDAEYVDKNCFESKKPVIVPGRTFLSQLV